MKLDTTRKGHMRGRGKREEEEGCLFASDHGVQKGGGFFSFF